jgi:hypothetical protein
MLLCLSTVIPVPKLTSHCSNISNGKCSQWRSTVYLESAHVYQKVNEFKQWWSQFNQYQQNIQLPLNNDGHIITIISKMDNHISSSLTEHKKTTTYDIGNLDTGLG